jgi:hypothetical protein
MYGAGEDNGIDHTQNRLRFLYDFAFLRSHYLHLHPYEPLCMPPTSQRDRRYLVPERGSRRTGRPITPVHIVVVVAAAVATEARAGRRPHMLLQGGLFLLHDVALTSVDAPPIRILQWLTASSSGWTRRTASVRATTAKFQSRYPAWFRSQRCR